MNLISVVALVRILLLLLSIFADIPVAIALPLRLLLVTLFSAPLPALALLSADINAAWTAFIKTPIGCLPHIVFLVFFKYDANLAGSSDSMHAMPSRSSASMEACMGDCTEECRYVYANLRKDKSIAANHCLVLLLGRHTFDPNDKSQMR